MSILSLSSKNKYHSITNIYIYKYIYIYIYIYLYIYRKRNPNTFSEIRTRDPQIVRAAAIPLDHWALKECLDYEACFIAPTAQVQCDIPKSTRNNGVRLILTSKFTGIYMYIRAYLIFIYIPAKFEVRIKRT